VVVVVRDPRLIAGDGASRLDAPHQAGVGKRAEHVVDGLRGNLPDVVTNGCDEGVRVGVRVVIHRSEHSDARLGHSQGYVP